MIDVMGGSLALSTEVYSGRDAIRDPWIRIIRQSIRISSIRIDFGLIRIIRLSIQ